MANIKIKIRFSKKSQEEGIIYYQITHQNLVRRISSGCKILAQEWHNGGIVVPRSGPRVEEVAKIRCKVEADRNRLCRIITDYDSHPADYTADDVVTEYREYMRKYSLFNYLERLGIWMKECGRTGTGESYIATLHSFANFRENEDVMIDAIDATLIESYEAWMKMRGLSPNSISFYLRAFRGVYRRALEDMGLPDMNPFRRVFTGREQTMKRAVPIDKLKKMRRMKLPEGSELAYSRDMFMLSIYLRGMNFIDMAYLSKDNFDGTYVCYRRRKTNRLLRIRWTKEIQSIVERYEKPVEPYLLPVFMEHSHNQMTYYRRILARVNRRLHEIGNRLGLTRLTMYGARHSWASVARQRGVNLSVISEGMGHSSESTTLIYLSTLDTSALDYANRVVARSIR